MGSEIALSYCLEDYKAAKAELLSTIDMQFKVLSILVTATAAVFVYLFKKDPHQIAFCACLIMPGIYAFFGTLWQLMRITVFLQWRIKCFQTPLVAME